MSEALGYEGVVFYATSSVLFGAAMGARDTVDSTSRSVTPDMSKGEARMTSRAQQGDEVFRAGRRTTSVDLEFVSDVTTALQTLLGDVFYQDADKVVGLKFLDKTAGEGFEGEFGVFAYQVSQPDSDEQILTVTIKLRGNLTRITT